MISVSTHSALRFEAEVSSLGVWDWYEDIIIDSGRQPLFLALVAFIATFVVTRAVTRLIRSGRSPFGNINAGGIHVHHVVPGVVAVLVGGLMGFSATRAGLWASAGAVLFGIGAALVLDEFALILHLDDVYWKQEGRVSADAVLIAVAFMGACLVIASPGDPPGPPETDPYVAALIPVIFIVFWVLPIGTTILKGKLFSGAISMVFPPIAWVLAIRLARPNSPWAHVRYSSRPKLMAKSVARYERVDARWRPLRAWFETHVLGFSNDHQLSETQAPTGKNEESEDQPSQRSSDSSVGQ